MRCYARRMGALAFQTGIIQVGLQKRGSPKVDSMDRASRHRSSHGVRQFRAAYALQGPRSRP